MSPYLSSPPRSLSEAREEIARQREEDTNQVFRLDRMRNELRSRGEP